jgi:hypothetical protein
VTGVWIDEDGVPWVDLHNPWGWRDEDHPPTGDFSMPLWDFMNIFPGMSYEDWWSDLPGEFTGLLDSQSQPADADATQPGQPAPPLFAGGYLPVSSELATLTPAGVEGPRPVDAPATGPAALDDPSHPADALSPASASGDPVATPTTPPAEDPFLTPLEGVTWAGVAV